MLLVFSDVVIAASRRRIMYGSHEHERIVPECAMVLLVFDIRVILTFTILVPQRFVSSLAFLLCEIFVCIKCRRAEICPIVKLEFNGELL